MLSIIYIILLLALCTLVTRHCPVVTFHGLTGSQPVLILCCAVTAAIFGAIVPEIFNNLLFWGVGPKWLEKTGQLAGIIGFFYLAIRGFYWWVKIFILGIFLFVMKFIFNLLINFYSS